MPAPDRVELTLESSLESVDRAEEEALQFARSAGFDEDDQTKIGMAVRESMVNAIYHGNKYDPAKKAGLKLELESGKMVITITDQGAGFELASVADPLAAENIMKSSGRGIFLIRTFMDEVQVRRLSPTGSEVRMVKNPPDGSAGNNGKEE